MLTCALKPRTENADSCPCCARILTQDPATSARHVTSRCFSFPVPQHVEVTTTCEPNRSTSRTAHQEHGEQFSRCTAETHPGPFTQLSRIPFVTSTRCLCIQFSHTNLSRLRNLSVWRSKLRAARHNNEASSSAAAPRHRRLTLSVRQSRAPRAAKSVFTTWEERRTF